MNLDTESQERFPVIHNHLHNFAVFFITFRYRPTGRLYRVTGRRVTDLREADASFSPFTAGAAEPTDFIWTAPSFDCHQIAMGLAIAMVE
jgi:hypothetical protein